LEDYYALLDQGRFPVVRGLALSRDAMLRRTVIMALMCQGAVEFEVVSSAWMIDFARYFATELRALETLAQAGLVDLDAHGIQVSDTGWFLCAPLPWCSTATCKKTWAANASRAFCKVASRTGQAGQRGR